MELNVVLISLTIIQVVTSLTLTNKDVTLELTKSDNNIQLSLSLGENQKLLGAIAEGWDLNLPEDCSSTCYIEGQDVALNITEHDSGFTLSWLTNDLTRNFQDCFELNDHWFGGPERWNSEWPIENMVISNLGYRTSKEDYGAVSERYWLNSGGAYIFVDDKVPLFLDQNSLVNGSVCFLAKPEAPFLGRNRVLLEYTLVATQDAREAHNHAVDNFLGKPTGHPNEWIVRHPIWTTWAKYKKIIDDNTVIEFAKIIADNGFTGQIEIDDYWETCYGSLTFNDDFKNINESVQQLKDLGFTVTLWTHPFVNVDCQEYIDIGETNGYFVKSTDGSDQTSWWDGDEAKHLDFSNEEARDWFINRLKLLQTKHGIDNFKFDAGETDWTPLNPVFQGDIELSPNSFTADYVRAAATFGDLIEVRAGWRTQDLPILVRMLDKDSRWGLDDGLHSVITTLLQFNIAGYTMVLPDIIGGDAYEAQPSAELLARWTQATTFMPAMQFSYLPWDIPSDEFDGVAIIKKYVALHEEHADEILEAMNNSINYGTPVNPPIWFIDPTNPLALQNNDEYLLGESILVAPIIEEGATSRDIVLPKGTWKDGNTGDVTEGPTVLKGYPAPIDILPYFIKQEN